MPIPAKKSLQIDPVPAKASKSYDSLWASKIYIGMSNPTSGYVRVGFNHYDGASGAVAPDNAASETEDLRVDDLPTAIAEVPEVAAAVDAIIAAIPALRTWQESQ